jgi:hypothetical protein
MARLFIKADKQGQILAVSRVDALPEGRKSPFDEDDPEIDIVEIKDPDGKSGFMEMQVVDIHTRYVLNAKKKALKKKASGMRSSAGCSAARPSASSTTGTFAPRSKAVPMRRSMPNSLIFTRRPPAWGR